MVGTPPGQVPASASQGPVKVSSACWLGRSGRAASRAFLAAVVLASMGRVDAVEVSDRLSELSRRAMSSATTSNLQALEAYGATATGTDRQLAKYAAGIAKYRARRYLEAEEAFAEISPGHGWVSERAAYYRARCGVLAEDFERALDSLDQFLRHYPESQFIASAVRLQVESLLRLRRLDQARSVLDVNRGRLEEPVRLYLAGRVEHIDGNRRKAIEHYREAYYHFPFSDQADASERHLDRLRASMGAAYPAAPAKWRLARAELLYDRRQYSRSSAEFTRALSSGLSGEDRDKAIVLRGAADFGRRANSTAYSALARARPASPDLDARRLYLLCELERRQGLVRPMLSSLSKLAEQHGGSPWYERALRTVGNFYFLRDDRMEYLRIFRRLVEAFPDGEHAPYAHWKICWRAWMDRSEGRATLLAEHLERYPAADTAAHAIYWLGRLSQQEGRDDEARSYFLGLVAEFPHYYWAGLARERLKQLGTSPTRDEVTRQIERLIPPPRVLASEPSSSTRARLEVGRALHRLGVGDEARRELQRVNHRQADAHFAGLALGRLHAGLGEHYRGLREMKRYAYGYLRFPIESIDAEYWTYLFPIGWEQSLRSRSRRHRLDPYLVAALIRQESEFNPVARSVAGARGLMQVMPSTGRGLFRRLGIPNFSTRKLTNPDTSLRLGTFHLKEALAKFDGQLELALAGYNAGDRRIPQWLKLGPFDEPAEFVETIPFSETRGYVQAVMRNRALYSLIYGD